MKSESSRTVGASRTAASRPSFSRKRVRAGAGCEVRGWGRATSNPAALPAPPAIVFFTLSSVNLIELARRPLDRVLGLRALRALGEHVYDHVLGVHLGGLGRRWPRIPDHPRVVGRSAEPLHRFIDRRPERMPLPLLRGADREPLRDLEPPRELLLAVEPLEEILGELGVLAVLHHAVGEGGVVAPGAGRPRRESGVLDVAHHRLALLVLDLVLPAPGGDVD